VTNTENNQCAIICRFVGEEAASAVYAGKYHCHTTSIFSISYLKILYPEVITWIQIISRYSSSVSKNFAGVRMADFVPNDSRSRLVLLSKKKVVVTGVTLVELVKLPELEWPFVRCWEMRAKTTTSFGSCKVGRQNRPIMI
jgi:hypothetical protein